MTKVNVINIRRAVDTNNNDAKSIREEFTAAGILALNLISSPGSGKTTLLEKTTQKLRAQEKESIVVVGDLETTRDADRLAPSTIAVTQINTGMSCHLYANQVKESLKDFDLQKADFIFIENIGNMVCPGEFDLGENLKVVLLSLPEGDDKVAKYPTIFRVADIVLLTKFDLKDVLDVDLDRIKTDIRKLNANSQILEISSKTGLGMDAWINWLIDQRQSAIGKQAGFVTE